MKKFVIFLLMPILMSCEKEIIIDYREADLLYVTEAKLTATGASVRLSYMQNVADNNNRQHIVGNAVVVLSNKYEGLRDTLRFVSSGYYISNTIGSPGVTYDLDIYAEGRHFSSSSTMQEAPDVQSFRFVWKKILTERILFADLRIQDDPDRSNYYFMQIFRGSVSYRWIVMSDEGNKGGTLQQLFQCCTERDMLDGDEDALRENDIIRVEVRTIDRASYDYFYSLQVMGGAGTNPVWNFSGGCLGYFSAYGYVCLNIIFHRNDAGEAD